MGSDSSVQTETVLFPGRYGIRLSPDQNIHQGGVLQNLTTEFTVNLGASSINIGPDQVVVIGMHIGVLNDEPF